LSSPTRTTSLPELPSNVSPACIYIFCIAHISMYMSVALENVQCPTNPL
jgi:hypothetical protein